MNRGSAAARLGIESDFIDARGRQRTVAPEVIERLVLALREGAGEATLAPTPHATTPPSQACQGPAGKWWLIATQLYGIRSERNWGHGDFSDLLALVELAADVGAAGVGINPIHALTEGMPQEASPYAPNSRLFLNPLYIDVDAIPEFAGCRTDDMAAEIARLRQTELVDYDGVATLKRRALRAAHQAFCRDGAPERRAAFEDFRQARHPTLARFAAFEVLQKRWPTPWWEWPAEWQTPDDQAIARLRDEAGDALAYHEYVQWTADQQLMGCRDRARVLGLPIGLYVDVAVGVCAGGFDAWNAPDAIVRRLAIGAPPDLLNTVGQDWGLAGFSGVGLQASGFAPFRAMLRASMRYAGAIRLDHVLGLKRLYFIPAGLPPDQGAYVRMPFEQLLEVTAEESAANRCIVVGEDLGTVPEGFREQVAQFGLWSYQVMLFERDWHGAFRPPEHYAERALVSFATHDLPTFAGWRTQHDLHMREAVNLPSGETGEERAQAIAALHEALRRQGFAELSFPSVAGYLASSSTRMLAIALEDVLEVPDQPNVPGTTDEHPNWRRKLPLELERIGDDPRLGEIARIAAERGRAARAEAPVAEQGQTIAR
jgi:4-alpha-glucanotransferase